MVTKISVATEAPSPHHQKVIYTPDFHTHELVHQNTSALGQFELSDKYCYRQSINGCCYQR
jgi:hypothetical protein